MASASNGCVAIHARVSLRMRISIGRSSIGVRMQAIRNSHRSMLGARESVVTRSYLRRRFRGGRRRPPVEAYLIVAIVALAGLNAIRLLLSLS
jgi:hypothetical protein